MNEMKSLETQSNPNGECAVEKDVPQKEEVCDEAFNH